MFASFIPMLLDRGDALIVVDVQRDFLPGGSLAVPDGDQVVPVINGWVERFAELDLPVFATRDWHPPDHCSFVEQGGTWPPHCVADTHGAVFADDLRLPGDATVISKATSPAADAYSGFDGTDLAERLNASGVKRVFVGGLATDYCVLATVRDALAAGFDVFVIEDAVRAVDVDPGDGDRALEAMRGLGARCIHDAQPEVAG